MDTLPEELQEIIDRQKIYDVLTRYCRALDRCDVEAMKTVYWPDGYDEHGVFNGNAQEFAVFIIEEIQKWFEVTQHTICNVHMEIDGDVATPRLICWLITGPGIQRTEFVTCLGLPIWPNSASSRVPRDPRTFSTAAGMLTNWRNGTASGASSAAPW